MKHHETMIVSTKRRGWLVLPALLLSLGCGRAPTGDIDGKITYFGKPLPAGTVTFLNSSDQAVGSSPISAQGNYSIVHAPVGPVKIIVTTPPVLAPSRSKGAAVRTKKKGVLIGKKAEPSLTPPITPVAIPAKFGIPDQSGQTYTVAPGKQEHPIELK